MPVPAMRCVLAHRIAMATGSGCCTIPAYLRAKHGLHSGDEVEVVEVGGVLQIARNEAAESRGQRLARRLRNTASSAEVAGMSTDEIMALLRAD
jgi:bifunctional DNA-binding transcriptional regulator/antitoxin component of YhaV-PrlF toxin-antitoxin module